MIMLKQINQINECSFLLDFGSNIDIKTNSFVINFSHYILNDKKNLKIFGIRNCVPSYNKILIQFNPNFQNKHKIYIYLKSIKFDKLQKSNNQNTRILEIPICYDEEFALDIRDISKKINLSKNEIIKLHLKDLLHVYMIGFMPGLPFLGDLDNKLFIHRKLSPRVSLPKGSVGIADKFCVIYPNVSPGGWNIIGRIPINLFYKKKMNPSLLEPGCKVKFKSISKKKFHELENIHE